MGYNKFQDRDGVVFLDLTADTVTEADVLEGVTFHKADGEEALGTLVQQTYELWDGSYTDLAPVTTKTFEFSTMWTGTNGTYTYEEGMTWQEFIDSEYNPLLSNGLKAFGVKGTTPYVIANGSNTTNGDAVCNVDADGYEVQDTIRPTDFITAERYTSYDD